MEQIDKPYSVNLWGSHPDEDNDDCWTGDDFDTLDDARAAADGWVDHFETPDLIARVGAGYYTRSTAFVEIAGPDVHEVRRVGHPKRDDGDSDWRREIAMEAGMLHGVEAFNEVMGWD